MRRVGKRARRGKVMATRAGLFRFAMHRSRFRAVAASRPPHSIAFRRNCDRYRGRRGSTILPNLPLFQFPFSSFFSKYVYPWHVVERRSTTTTTTTKTMKKRVKETGRKGGGGRESEEGQSWKKKERIGRSPLGTEEATTRTHCSGVVDGATCAATARKGPQQQRCT